MAILKCVLAMLLSVNLCLATPPIYSSNFQSQYQPYDFNQQLQQLLQQREYLQKQAQINALRNQQFYDTLKLFGYVNAPQGETQYVFEKQVDPTLLFNQADRHTNNAQSAATQAEQGFKTLIEKQIHLEALRAKVELLKAAESPAKQVSNGSSFAASANPEPVLKQHCVSCHNATKPSGGFDLTKYEAFNAEQKKRVRASIVNPDPEKRMPKDAPALSFDDIVLFRE